MVVVLGADVHKKSHTIVAVDPTGRELGQLTVPATAAGHAGALDWARALCGTEERIWGIEDCRSMSAGLEADLAAAGERTVRVPARLTARSRASARTRGKSDPIDALAIARAALREPGLPGPAHDAAAEELRLLTARRDDLVAERTRFENRLREHLHVLDPAREPAKGSLDRAVVQDRLRAWLQDLAGVRAQIARDVLEDIARLTAEIKALHRRIGALARASAPAVLAIPGCGELTAGKLVGEAGDVARFRDEGCFASFVGTAPIPVWSGNTQGRVRLNRGGNRQVNAAIHRIAITQIRIPGPGQDYYRRRLAEGKSRRDAIRCLKRHITRAVYRALLADAHTHAQPAALPAAA